MVKSDVSSKATSHVNLQFVTSSEPLWNVCETSQLREGEEHEVGFRKLIGDFTKKRLSHCWEKVKNCGVYKALKFDFGYFTSVEFIARMRLLVEPLYFYRKSLCGVLRVFIRKQEFHRTHNVTSQLPPRCSTRSKLSPIHTVPAARRRSSRRT